MVVGRRLALLRPAEAGAGFYTLALCVQHQPGLNPPM